MTSKSTRRSQKDNQAAWRGAVILGALIVAAIVVAMTLGNFGSNIDTAAALAAQIPTSGDVVEVAPATTAGTPLPKLDGRNDPAVGQPAPAITASHFDGTEATIDFTDGQPRALIFVAHWCPHCQAEISALVERFRTEGTRDDVEIIAVSTGVDTGAPNYPPSDWFLDESWPLPVLRDSLERTLAADFGLTGFPFMVLVDSDGNIVKRHSGAIPESEWNATLDLALSSKNVNG